MIEKVNGRLFLIKRDCMYVGFLPRLLGPTILSGTLEYMGQICKFKRILLDFLQLILLLTLVRSNSMTMCQRL